MLLVFVSACILLQLSPLNSERGLKYYEEAPVSQGIEEEHMQFAKRFGQTDPLMELLYHQAFLCGTHCFGVECLDLSPADFRLRQHQFTPGEEWIGQKRLGESTAGS